MESVSLLALFATPLARFEEQCDCRLLEFFRFHQLAQTNKQTNKQIVQMHCGCHTVQIKIIYSYYFAYVLLLVWSGFRLHPTRRAVDVLFPLPSQIVATFRLALIRSCRRRWSSKVSI